MAINIGFYYLTCKKDFHKLKTTKLCIVSGKSPMVDINELSSILKEQLKPVNPEKIILFGSYARGTQTKDSDIDIYIVTKDDFIPQSFNERKELYKKVLSHIRNIIQTYPTDVIIHTKKMHEKFLEMDSHFCREIMTKGIRIV